jgi:membrane-associated protein
VVREFRPMANSNDSFARATNGIHLALVGEVRRQARPAELPGDRQSQPRTVMHLITGLFDFILHIDKHLGDLITHYGTLTYAILFAILFAETGLVVTPFLPGDSLLFAAGAFAALGALDYVTVLAVIGVAVFVGDNTNYWIGRKLGPAATSNPNSRVFKREYLEMTEAFYRKHGGKTIILARYMPIVRTFTPFMAGVGAMPYRRFVAFSVVSAALWVFSFVTAGYLFGNVPWVKHNFSVVVIAIVLLSISPAIYHWLRIRLAARRVRSEVA